MQRLFQVYITVLFLSGVVFGQNTYLGVENASCNAGCHGTYFADWGATAHATAYDSLKNILGYSCLQCHTVGWDTNVDNGGADEYVTEGDANSYTIDDSAKFALVSNIQCENCHGPVGNADGSGIDFGHTSREVSLDAVLCGDGCHQGSHHPTWENLQESKHAFSKETTIPGGAFAFIKNDRECSACHTAEGFLQYLGQPDFSTPDVDPPGEAGHDITCQTCHDPHDATNEGQLRIAKDRLCDKCHNPEYNPDAPTPDGSEPHHTTAFMFDGKGGWEYDGYTYENSVHTVGVTDRCVACHVFMIPFESEEIPAYTGHGFTPQNGACEDCHTDFADFWATDSSFDYRGVQSEIDSLLSVLNDKLAAASPEDSTSDAFYRAKFNHDFVESDGSHGIHNTKYARGLLESAITEFTPSAIEQDMTMGIPEAYALNQNYPNPFNPSTEIEFAIRKSGQVTLVVYDLLGREVATLVNEKMQPGSYSARFEAGDLASGVYVYRLTAGNEFSAVRKMVLIR